MLLCLSQRAILTIFGFDYANRLSFFLTVHLEVFLQTLSPPVAVYILLNTLSERE